MQVNCGYIFVKPFSYGYADSIRAKQELANMIGDAIKIDSIINPSAC